MVNNSLYNWPVNQPKPIDPKELERLFALGLDDKTIAKELGVSVSNLRRRISWTASLREAKKRGIAKQDGKA